MKLIITIILSMFLSACVTYSQKVDSIVSKIPENERAYVLGKFIIQCKPYDEDCIQAFNSLSLFYKDTTGDEFPGRLNSTSGSIFGNDTIFDFIEIEKEQKGYYFCQVVPDSNYAFYKYSYYNFAGGGSGYSLSEDSYFNLPFRASARDLTYLGSFKLTTSVGENVFGMDINGPGKLIVESSTEDDLQRAIAKCPEKIRNMNLHKVKFKRQATSTITVK